MDEEVFQEPLFQLPPEQQVLVELSEVRSANAALYQELQLRGRRPDPAGVALLKLQALLDLALPEDERNKVELVFEQRMTTVLRDCLRELAHEKLIQPTTPGGDHLRPGTLLIPGR